VWEGVLVRGKGKSSGGPGFLKKKKKLMLTGAVRDRGKQAPNRTAPPLRNRRPAGRPSLLGRPARRAPRAPRVFFFQAEDGIRDWSVTGVQTCALPIYIGQQTRPLQKRHCLSCQVQTTTDH